MVKVGTLVKLNQPMLGNPANVVGIVYENYNIGAGPGVSVIFPNGNYDGFSPDEQKQFLTKVDFSKAHADYQFTNVMRLSDDFREGKFGVIDAWTKAHAE